MEARLGWAKTDIEAHRALQGIETYLKGTGLDGILIELVKVRTSQINGCAYCIDVHVRVARELGETDRRLHLLNAWREAPFFTDRERAALAWTEAIALVNVDHVPDDVYALAREHFSEKELVALTMVAVSINSYNRMHVAFRTMPRGE
jgi:AhpD family alkylhydroperoxidase